MEKPTAYGFADNGELWETMGGAPGLIKYLEAQSVGLRDWFVNADWATEENLQERTIPNLALVHPIQDYIAPEAVAGYMESPEVGQEKDFFERYPTLFIWEGRFFLFQGTHRLAALHEAGDSSYRGWLINLDG